ncbi:hypothetical protein M5K25_004116 [Dendrobium thyrsiflorum]|uniref:Cellulose synthase-like protein G3 n=1 Tax=Dendrobium thyrsiflorum TaxID=117978 RepID=A0ABD0VT93_DENTH
MQKLRVSETMTNAPLILTLDCDMFSNDPNAPQRALCYFLDKDFSPNLSFIQFPQIFTGLNKNDIYSSGEFRRVFILGEQGLDGLQGPNYVGTGCFFSCRSLYSSPPVAMPSSDEFKVQSCLLSSKLVLLKAHEAACSEYEHGRKECVWACWCIPLNIYGLFPQLDLFYGKSLFPNASDPWFFLYAYILLSTYVLDFIEFMEVGGLIQRWWSEQRMWLINAISSSTFETLDFILSQIGCSAPGFNLTSKVKKEEKIKLYENGKFVFSIASPFFVSMGTIAIVNALIRVGGLDEMLIQLLLSGFIVTNSWPIYEAMFTRKDGGKMPESVTKASILLSIILFCLANFYFT